MYTYNAKINRIIDGDTVVLDIDLGFDVKVTKHIRLIGYDAPEMRGESKDEGFEAKLNLGSLLGENKLPIVQLTTSMKDKYGRWLGTIYRNSVNINKEMTKLYGEYVP